MTSHKSLHTITDDLDELFIVVDRTDTIIDYRPRRDCHRDKSLIHRAVGILVYDDIGRVLLQKRSLTKDLQPGTWSISAAGHVTRGEEYVEAAHRELKEELGIESVLTQVDVHFFEDEREREMEALFQAVHPGPFLVHPQEVDRVEFFSKRDLMEKIKTNEVKLSTWAEFTLKHVNFLP